MQDHNLPRCASPSGWTRSVPGPRSGPSPTPTTTLWPRRPTGSTRPSASTGLIPVVGRTSRTSNWRPCPGCTGSTNSGCTGTAATFRRRSTKQRSTLAKTPTRSDWNPIRRAAIRPRAIHRSVDPGLGRRAAVSPIHVAPAPAQRSRRRASRRCRAGPGRRACRTRVPAGSAGTSR